MSVAKAASSAVRVFQHAVRSSRLPAPRPPTHSFARLYRSAAVSCAWCQACPPFPLRCAAARSRPLTVGHGSSNLPEQTPRNGQWASPCPSGAPNAGLSRPPNHHRVGIAPRVELALSGLDARADRSFACPSIAHPATAQESCSRLLFQKLTLATLFLRSPQPPVHPRGSTGPASLAPCPCLAWASALPPSGPADPWC